MTVAEQARYAASVLLETCRSSPRILLARLGLRGGGHDPSEYAPPDSALVRHAFDACADLDPMLVQHGIRSYLFARALGQRDGVRCDPEALFLAALLHDYAFPGPATTDPRCFAFAGAEAAREILDGMSPGAVRGIQNAITLHLNPRVPRSQGAVPHLLHAGVMADVVGIRMWHLDPSGVERVLLRHPRHRFSTRAPAGFRAHGLRVPAGRARMAWRCGFGYAMHLGPWPAHEARTRACAGAR